MRGAEYVSHPLIRSGSVERRAYQENIVKSCLQGNSLVVLPTGLGKSVIALLAVAERLRRFPGGRCFLLAPTRPLVQQHYKAFKAALALGEEELELFTGEIPPRSRAGTSGRVAFFTPQVLEIDYLQGRVALEDVVLLVVDEAHRAVGKYPYVFLAEEYMKKARNPLILGLTASPGSTREKIEEIKRNLKIAVVEARTDRSPDVRPYLQPVEVEWSSVELAPELERIRAGLRTFLEEKVSEVRRLGVNLPPPSHLTFKNFTEALEALRKEMAQHPQPPEALRSAHWSMLALKRASHALELLETQGLSAFMEYTEKLRALGERPGAPPAVKAFILHGAVWEALNLAAVYQARGLEHPKVEEVMRRVSDAVAKGARRIIVFANLRSTARKITEALNSLEGVRALRFVGQRDRAEDGGLSQRAQAQLLEEFRRGGYNVLVATQVAEEGLDIAGSDVVVFYDNVPSAVRFIQRRGRTARTSPGKVIILATKNTRDEAYFWIAKRKERAMRSFIRELQASERERREPGPSAEGTQPTLDAFSASRRDDGGSGGSQEPAPRVLVDSREAASAVVRELRRFGCELTVTTLPAGDYAVSGDVVFERKTVKDLAASIIDKRLFSQAKEIAASFRRPLVIVEGWSEGGVGGVSHQALRGAMLSLILDFRIPVLLTKDETETALMIYSAAKAIQKEGKTHVAIREEKKPLTLAEQQEYLVAGLPHVELTLARRLLSEFGSVERLFNATAVELQKVKGVGEAIARKIRSVIESPYRPEGGEGG